MPLSAPDRARGCSGRCIAATTRLSGAHQRRRQSASRSCARCPAGRSARHRAVPAGRRPERRVHPAQHVRRLHHQRVQRQLYRPRAGNRPPHAELPAILSRDVPAHAVRHEPGADRQQHRPDVGGGRTGNPHHRGDGRHLPHPRGDRGRLEILHPRQRRHRARAVRHHPGLSRRAPRRRRGHRCHGLDHPDHPRARLRPGTAQHRLHLPAAGLRHQGRPRADARLAARRARRGPDADLGRALRSAAERRALRAAALQDAAGRQPRRHRPRPADDRARPDLADLRRLHAVPPARHQTHVRLFVDRAHGHHRVRLRHGGPARATSPACCR